MIDFAKIEGPVYTGRDRGERLRKEFHLDEADKDQAEIDVVIPDETYSISSSFFLGMFGRSITSAGNKEKFLQRYHFRTSKFLQGIIDGHIARALQERNLFS